MAEEVKSSTPSMGWNTFNTVLGIAGLGSALGIGIPAVTKAFSKNNCNNSGDCCNENTLVNRYELMQSQRISELESANTTDAKLLEVYKAAAASDQRQDEKFAQLTKALTDYIISNNRDVDSRFAKVDCEAKVNQQEIRDNLRFLDYKIDNNQREMFAYVDCKTIPLEKKIGINQICPTPLAACAPLAVKGQFINTEDSNQTNTVVGNVKSK